MRADASQKRYWLAAGPLNSKGTVLLHLLPWVLEFGDGDCRVLKVPGFRKAGERGQSIHRICEESTPCRRSTVLLPRGALAAGLWVVGRVAS